MGFTRIWPLVGFWVGCPGIYLRTERWSVLLQMMAAVGAGMDVENILCLVVMVGKESFRGDATLTASIGMRELIFSGMRHRKDMSYYPVVQTISVSSRKDHKPTCR